MANLTITVDDAALRRARIRAASEGRSVNALLKQVLEDYAGVRREQEAAMADLVALSKASQSRQGTLRWSRDELHERDSHH